MKVLPFIVVASVDATAAQRGAANYLCDGVDDESQINSAITEANAAGGGWVLLTAGTYNCNTIIMKTNVYLSGNGMGTLVKLNDNADTYLLSTADGITDFTLRDMVFDGNKANQTDTTKPVIYIDNTSGNNLHSSLTRIRIQNGKGVGFYGIWPRRIQIIDSYCDANDGHGIHYTKGHVEMVGIWSIYNGGDGLHVDDMEDTHIIGSSFTWNDAQGINKIVDSTIEGCVIYGNDLDGIGELNKATAIGCTIRFNKRDGIKKLQDASVIGCFIQNNEYDGIGTNGCIDSHIIGNIISNNSYNNDDTYPEIYITRGCTIQNNTIGSTSYVHAKYSVRLSNTGYGNVIANNRIYEGMTATFYATGYPADTLPEAHTVLNNTLDLSFPNQTIGFYKNTSGGNLVKGHCVIRKAVANLDEIDTTTTPGDPMTLGMLAEDIDNNAWGRVLLTGKTIALKVKGITPISIGDLITTSTVAGVGSKGASGNLCFAIAKEAYAVADSNGIIDAELVKLFEK